MRKIILLSAIAFSIAFTSCKKKSKQEEEQPDPFTLEYSNLSVEDQKKEIEKAGIEFVNKINGLPDQKFVTTLSFFSDLGFANELNSVSSIQGIASASKQKNITGILNASNKLSSDTYKLSDEFGIYTWNHTDEEWVFTNSTDRLEYRFPATENSHTNNAVLNFTYKASSVTADLDGDKGELPASIIAVLTVDGKEELKYTSTFEYKSDGTPSKTDLNVALGAYTFKSSLNNTGADASTSFSFLKDKETLISLSAGANGNLNIKEDEEFEDIVKNANVTFEIMHIKLAGQADIKAISTAEKANQLSGEAKAKKEAEIWNSNSKFVAVNKSNNTLIAKVEFISEANEYYDWIWTGTGTERVTRISYDLAPRLVFHDGSKQSFDEFVEKGFGALTADVEDLATN